jgi:hypothetical protein
LTMDISDLASGMYFICVTGNETFLSYKLIVRQK